MGILATMYFKKDNGTNKYHVQALSWAELAAEYDIIQKGLTTRFVIRKYMNAVDIDAAEKVIKERKKVFDKMPACTY